MSIDKLPVFKKFPAGKEQTRLVRWIESEVYSIASRRINWILDRIIDGGIEFPPDGSGPGDDGNWRFLVSGDEFITQKRVSSAWVNVHTFSGGGIPTDLLINTNVEVDAFDADSVTVRDSSGNVVFFVNDTEFFVNAFTPTGPPPTIPAVGNPMGLLLSLTYAA